MTSYPNPVALPSATGTFVVFESMFGNTRLIAEAIAAGLGETTRVTIGSVDEIAPEQVPGAALIVVGGPTHAYGVAKSDARRTLAKARFGKKTAGLLPGQQSLRGWLERLPAGRAQVATFDTRFNRPRWLTGSAAVKVARVVQGKGYSLIGTQSFLVQGTGGPLIEGERERALAWGRELAAGRGAADAIGVRAAA